MPIGILVGHEQSEGCFVIELDYVSPAYRDFKMGEFVYSETDFFRNRGYKMLLAPSSGSSHDAYLKKMQFTKAGDFYQKPL